MTSTTRAIVSCRGLFRVGDAATIGVFVTVPPAPERKTFFVRMPASTVDRDLCLVSPFYAHDMDLVAQAEPDVFEFGLWHAVVEDGDYIVKYVFAGVDEPKIADAATTFVKTYTLFEPSGRDKRDLCYMPADARYHALPGLNEHGRVPTVKTLGDIVALPRYASVVANPLPKRRLAEGRILGSQSWIYALGGDGDVVLAMRPFWAYFRVGAMEALTTFLCGQELVPRVHRGLLHYGNATLRNMHKLRADGVMTTDLQLERLAKDLAVIAIGFYRPAFERFYMRLLYTKIMDKLAACLLEAIFVHMARRGADPADQGDVRAWTRKRQGEPVPDRRGHTMALARRFFPYPIDEEVFAARCAAHQWQVILPPTMRDEHCDDGFIVVLSTRTYVVDMRRRMMELAQSCGLVARAWSLEALMGQGWHDMLRAETAGLNERRFTIMDAKTKDPATMVTHIGMTMDARQYDLLVIINAHTLTTFDVVDILTALARVRTRVKAGDLHHAKVRLLGCPHLAFIAPWSLTTRREVGIEMALRWLLPAGMADSDGWGEAFFFETLKSLVHTGRISHAKNGPPVGTRKLHVTLPADAYRAIVLETKDKPDACLWLSLNQARWDASREVLVSAAYLMATTGWLQWYTDFGDIVDRLSKLWLDMPPTLSYHAPPPSSFSSD